MKNKLEVLKRIAMELNDQGITWAIGASTLLYFNGIVNEFHDLDIMIDDNDAEKAIKVLDKLGKHIISPFNPNFKTKHFLEYIIDNVEVDCIGGFIVVKDNVDYDCSLDINDIVGEYDLDGIKIPLYSLEKWKYFYFLINRENKVKMIDNYYKNKRHS